jgi:excisionase family DNA binding protein
MSLKEVGAKDEQSCRCDGFLTISEVAELLKISTRTVRRMTADGLLPVYRFSHKLLRFRADEVQNALARVRIPARSEKTKAA